MPQEQVESSETAFKHDYELGQRAVFPATTAAAPSLPPASLFPLSLLNYAKRSRCVFGIGFGLKMRHIAGI